MHDAAGALLGMGYYNPATTIAIRMIAWGETPAIEELVARRLKSALELRRRFVRDDTECVPADQRRRRRTFGRGGRSIWRRDRRANPDCGRGPDARDDCCGAERTAASALDHRTQPRRGQKAGGTRRSHCGSGGRNRDRDDRGRERNQAQDRFRAWAEDRLFSRPTRQSRACRRDRARRAGARRVLLPGRICAGGACGGREQGRRSGYVGAGARDCAAESRAERASGQRASSSSMARRAS